MARTTGCFLVLRRLMNGRLEVQGGFCILREQLRVTRRAISVHPLHMGRVIEGHVAQAVIVGRKRQFFWRPLVLGHEFESTQHDRQCPSGVRRLQVHTSVLSSLCLSFSRGTSRSCPWTRTPSPRVRDRPHRMYARFQQFCAWRPCNSTGLWSPAGTTWDDMPHNLHSPASGGPRDRR